MAGVVVMKIANSVWTFFGSATLSVWALLGLVVVLCCGYYLFEAAPTLYEPLNRLLLWDWIKSYGWHNLTNTWWFLSFLVLLGLLVANTFVCTWQKVAVLAKRGAKGSRLDFVLRFSPHVMHAAFIIILASHLFTYVFGLNVQNNLVLLGREITIPGSEIKLRLDSIKSDFFTGDRLAFFKRRALSQEIKLSLMGADGSVIQKTLAYNSPIWHRGYSIHLKSYYPKAKTSMPRRPYANLIIRWDPGVRTFFCGTIIFAVGLLAYLWQALRQHRQRAFREAQE
jgi:cytochrome c biogenesis protein ResB